MTALREADFDQVFDSQQIFRIILDTMARPGKIGILPDINIKPPAENHYPFLVLLTLLDREVSFNVQGKETAKLSEVIRYLELNTGSKQNDVEACDFMLVYGGNSKAQICKAKIGSFRYPDKSATVLYDVDSISDENTLEKEESLLKLSGPGIKENCIVGLSGIGKKEMENLVSVREFPLGIDAIFTDKNGRIISIPRSTSLKVL